MIIHNVFLDVGLQPLTERKNWLENIEINKRLNPEAEFMLWDDEKVDELIETKYSQYKDMISTFPHKFYKVDFCRYLILKEYGGIYIDLDVKCRKPIPKDVRYICGNSNTRPSINNNLISLPPKEVNGLLDFCVSEYNRITENNLYAKWKGRHFFNSVSAYMFKRYCKKNGITSDIDFHEYFADGEAGSWIDSGLVKKHYFKKVAVENDNLNLTDNK